MNIIIVGAGRVGRSLSKTLSEEGNEIFLVDQSEERVKKATEKLDVKVVLGNGADPDTLKRAEVDHADLVLAVTTSDETNLVVCALAAMFGAKRRIARVRNTSLSRTLAEQGYSQFSINDIINPELVAAQAIVKTVLTPGASEVADFADGRLLLRGFNVPEASPLCGSTLQEMAIEDFPWPFLIISVIRDNKVSIARGDTVIEAKDHIYVLLPSASLGEFLTYVNPEIKMPKKVIIYGASITGKHVAELLKDKIKDIVLVEEDEEKAQKIAGELATARIINGSASEVDILTECGVEAADAFIATSNNDHSNFISSVIAKKMGAKTTVITTQQPDYMSIVNALDIDAIINPHYLAVEQILRLVRGGRISSVTKFAECDAEAVEFIPQEDSPIVQHPLKKIKFPKEAIVGAVYSKESAALARGDTHIKPGEKVIVFCQQETVPKLQKLFTHK